MRRPPDSLEGRLVESLFFWSYNDDGLGANILGTSCQLEQCEQSELGRYGLFVQIWLVATQTEASENCKQKRFIRRYVMEHYTREVYEALGEQDCEVDLWFDVIDKLLE